MNGIISINEFYDNLANELSKEIADYSPQIFFDKYKKINLPLFPDCSSILITIDERYFLITAAHCVHNTDISSIGIMIENDFFTIGGNVKYFEPNDMNFYEPNNLDIAIYELHSEAIIAFKEKYKFLNIDQLGLNYESSEISRYILFGYPEYKTRRHAPTKTIVSVPLIVRTTGVSKESYVKEKIDYTKILILNADQKNVMSSTTKTSIELPDLNGISGCGIWNISNVFDKKPQYKLVSILTGENLPKTFLYSARVDYLRILFQAYFDVRSL